MEVSFIIPAYNAEKTIVRCIDSILCQSQNSDIEIIVVDDGSEDKTQNIVRNLSKEIYNLRYLRKVNGGVSSARNYGLKYAKGKWIMFVDSDDELKQNLLSSLLQSTERNDLIIAGIEVIRNSGTEKVSHKGRYTAIEVIENYGLTIPTVLLNGPCSKLYKNQIINNYNLEFDEGISLGEDTLFVFNYLKHCDNIEFIDEVGYIYYQVGNDSLMTKFREDGYDNAKNVYNQIIDIAKEIRCNDIPESIKKAYVNVLTGYLRKLVINRRKVSEKKIDECIKDYIENIVVRDFIKQYPSLTMKIISKMVKEKRCQSLKKFLIIHTTLRGN